MQFVLRLLPKRCHEKSIPSLKRGISIIGSALDSTPPEAGLRKTLERQPLIDPNREERFWKDDSARGHMSHKNCNKTASKVFGSPVCGKVRPSGFNPRFAEALLRIPFLDCKDQWNMLIFYSFKKD